MKPIEYICAHEISENSFDAIIDVRSPSEFSADHVPEAINLPALSDSERGDVGSIYKNFSPFEARKLGGALIAENVGQHLRQILVKNKQNWKPLIYCWRGGQRSKAFATILSEVGWKVSVIEGGYKSYRKLVYTSLYEDTLERKIYLIAGNTGTAKTQILKLLGDEGVNIIDLEGLANHRGSVFGSLDDNQPTQKSFESELYRKIKSFDPKEPIVLEAESNKIGNISLPSALWKKMKIADRIVLSGPLKERSKYLVKEYLLLIRDQKRFLNKLASLKQIQGQEKIIYWSNLFKEKNYTKLAEELIIHHYDPRYNSSSDKNGYQTIKRIELDKFEPSDLNAAVCKIKSFLKL